MLLLEYVVPSRLLRSSFCIKYRQYDKVVFCIKYRQYDKVVFCIKYRQYDKVVPLYLFGHTVM